MRLDRAPGASDGFGCCYVYEAAQDTAARGCRRERNSQAAQACAECSIVPAVRLDRAPLLDGAKVPKVRAADRSLEAFGERFARSLRRSLARSEGEGYAAAADEAPADEAGCSLLRGVVSSYNGMYSPDALSGVPRGLSFLVTLALSFLAAKASPPFM